MKRENTIEANDIESPAKQTTEIKKTVFWEMFVIFGILTVILLLIIGRLFYIQIINHDVYIKIAEKQQQSKEIIVPQRGNIYDRNGILLASSIKYISIAIDPTIIKKIDSVAILLAKCKDISKNEIIKKIKQVQNENNKKEKSKRTQYLHLASRISSDKEIYFKKLQDRGIIIETEYIRHYNYSNIATQILGHTDNNNKGTGGIEYQYDSILSGITGYRYVYKDAKGNKRLALDLPTILPVDGANLYLTIDIDLQEIVEYELTKGVLNAAAESGTIIVLEPETGEVLACASYPSYNPNNSLAYNPEAARIRSITDMFEPGSTFKAITAAAGIEEKKVKLSDIFNGYQGLYKQNTYTIIDDHRLGMTSFYNAFINSSNIILGELAVRMKKDIFMRYIRDFGYGSVTGIDLPGEIKGYVPKLDSIQNWTLRYLGHGYRTAVTPIQMVTAYSAIANNGNLLKPYVVKKIVDKDSVILGRSKQQIRKVMSYNTSNILKSLLSGVVREGTGKQASINGLKIAGKTGTAKKWWGGTYKNTKYIGSFIGFYPTDKPKICMFVVIDEPLNDYYGGSVAAPIFRNIALRYATVNSDIINDYGNKGSTDLVYMPDLKGLKYETGIKILTSLGLQYVSDKQSGTIVNQNPYSGARIKKQSNVKINLTESSENLNIKLPKVVGLPVRNAISVLHANGYMANISGFGKVYSQEWKINDKKERICHLKCKQ